MSPSVITRDEEITADLLNETILRAASDDDTDVIAPESTRSTSEVTARNESPEALGFRVPERPLDPVESIAEQLVNAGADEAEIEKRLAAAKSE